jgi:biotin carboxyl carrier protein
VTSLALEVNGVVRRVQVEVEGARFIVTLDGVRHVLDAAEIERGRWSLLFDAERHSHEVLVRSGQNGTTTVIVDGATVPIRVLDPRRQASAASGGAAGGDGPIRVTAPMPGKVIRVLVKPGDAVTARQGLVVVEAMKMENELRAPRDGTVRDVQAREGASVETGALLLTIG